MPRNVPSTLKCVRVVMSSVNDVFLRRRELMIESAAESSGQKRIDTGTVVRIVASLLPAQLVTRAGVNYFASKTEK